jgi:hypothetical protein
VNLERAGRLLLALAGSLGVIGMAIADNRLQFGRYLGLSGCLLMLGLALLLLAPRPATGADRRTRPGVRPANRTRGAAHRVPQQRIATPAEAVVTPAHSPRVAAHAAPVDAVATPGRDPRAA